MDDRDPWRAQTTALGAFIRAQRTLADLSLREMAAATQVSNAYLSQIERGLHQPSVRVLHAIAAALGVSPEQLLAQAGPTAPSPAADAADAGPAKDGGATTESSILADPRLTDAQREALLSVYRSFLGPGDVPEKR